MKLKNNIIKYIFLSSILLICSNSRILYSQENFSEPTSSYQPAESLLWLNSYGNIQLTDNLLWIAQTHIRFVETENTPVIGQLAQIYKRHALSYLVSKQFNASLGGVLRLDFNPNKRENQSSMIPEWRIWHEYMFAMPFPSLMVYHRLRVEHRWSKSYEENSDFIFRNRWRYMLNLKIPLNNDQLTPGTYYLSPEVELIMQSGSPVINSPLEDLRLHTSIGYIVNPRLILASGLMYTMGQNLFDGSNYRQRWVLRLHAYFSFDLRKNQRKLPEFEFPILLND